MQNVDFRPVRLDDAQQIAAIYNHYVEHTDISFETVPLTDIQMRQRIAGLTGERVVAGPSGQNTAAFPYIVCEEEGVILGYAYAHPWKERAAYCHTLETTVYLRPGYVRLGLGRMLMLRLIDECRLRGVHVLVACITGGNNASIALHTSLGFTQASLFPQVGYKNGRWLDVVDLILIL